MHTITKLTHTMLKQSISQCRGKFEMSSVERKGKGHQIHTLTFKKSKTAHATKQRLVSSMMVLLTAIKNNQLPIPKSKNRRMYMCRTKSSRSMRNEPRMASGTIGRVSETM